MSGRALLNRIYARAVDRMDEQEHRNFKALLADPETVLREQRQQRLADLIAIGGEVG